MRARAKSAKVDRRGRPRETGHYRRTIRQRSTRICASDIAWHIIEFGGVDRTDLRADAPRRDRCRLHARAFAFTLPRTPSAPPGGEQIASATQEGGRPCRRRTFTELVVASYGDLYVAPSRHDPSDQNGTPDVDPAFQNLGLTTEDSVTFGYALRVPGLPALGRSKTDVRRELTRSRLLARRSASSSGTAQSFQLAFGGGDVVEGGAGSCRYDFPDDTAALAAYAIVVDWQDGESTTGSRTPPATYGVGRGPAAADRAGRAAGHVPDARRRR